MRGRPLGLCRGKILRFGSLPTSEQGGLPYGAAEYQLYARIQPGRRCEPTLFYLPRLNGVARAMEIRGCSPISKGLSDLVSDYLLDRTGGPALNYHFS